VLDVKIAEETFTIFLSLTTYGERFTATMGEFYAMIVSATEPTKNSALNGE